MIFQFDSRTAQNNHRLRVSCLKLEEAGSIFFFVFSNVEALDLMITIKTEWAGFFSFFARTCRTDKAFNTRKAAKKKADDARTVVLKEENRTMEQSIREKEAQMKQIFGIFAAHARVNTAIAMEPKIQVGDIYVLKTNLRA